MSDLPAELPVATAEIISKLCKYVTNKIYYDLGDSEDHDPNRVHHLAPTDRPDETNSNSNVIMSDSDSSKIETSDIDEKNNDTSADEDKQSTPTPTPEGDASNIYEDKPYEAQQEYITEILSQYIIQDDDINYLYNQHKEHADNYFKSNDYTKAIHHYTCALLYKPSIATVYSNRSLCHIREEHYAAALTDGKMALQCDPKFFKAYYRIGAAETALNHLDEAVKAYGALMKAYPSDRNAAKLFDTTKKELNKRKFAQAISNNDDKGSILDIQLNERQIISFNSTWGGPKISWEEEYKAPPSTWIDDDSRQYYSSKYTPEFVQYIIDIFRDGNYSALPAFAVEIILSDFSKYMSTLPTVVDINIPSTQHLTVCGDTHGQYYDFLNILSLNGKPTPTNPYLFNGDFVDRGSWGYELVLTLMLYKLSCPISMHLTRGNHESLAMNQSFGFTGEVNAKCKGAATRIFKLFTYAFNTLPLAIILGSQVLVLHGGLFEDSNASIDDLRKVNRFRQIPDKGLMCDALWSDPAPYKSGRSPGIRGCGIQWGSDVTEAFCKQNGLKLIVRSHEMRHEGYTVHHNGRVVTIFSAPNYVDQSGNLGAYMIFNDNYDYEFKQFKEVPHPNVPPMAYMR